MVYQGRSLSVKMKQRLLKLYQTNNLGKGVGSPGHTLPLVNRGLVHSIKVTPGTGMGMNREWKYEVTERGINYLKQKGLI